MNEAEIIEEEHDLLPKATSSDPSNSEPNKGTVANAALDCDESSEEEMHLKWDDDDEEEDEEIEADIISLRPPGYMYLDTPETCSSKSELPLSTSGTDTIDNTPGPSSKLDLPLSNSGTDTNDNTPGPSSKSELLLSKTGSGQSDSPDTTAEVGDVCTVLTNPIILDDKQTDLKKLDLKDGLDENASDNIKIQKDVTDININKNSSSSSVSANAGHGLNEPNVMVKLFLPESMDYIADSDVPVSSSEITSPNEKVLSKEPITPCEDEEIKTKYDMEKTEIQKNCQQHPDSDNTDGDSNLTDKNPALVSVQIKHLVLDDSETLPIIDDIKTKQLLSSIIIYDAKCESTNNSKNKEPALIEPTLIEQEQTSLIFNTTDTEQPLQKLSEEEPSTFSTHENQSSTLDCQKEQSDELPDSKDEAPEVTDRLGLLAVSSARIMDDDDEPEDEEEEDDIDHDDSSSQMTTEHSEDSNAQQSEPDVDRNQEQKSPDASDKELGKNREAKTNLETKNIPSGMETEPQTKQMDLDSILEEVESASEPMAPEVTADDSPTYTEIETITENEQESTSEQMAPEAATDDSPTYTQIETITENEQEASPETTVEQSEDTSNNAEEESNECILRKMLKEHAEKQIQEASHKQFSGYQKDGPKLAISSGKICAPVAGGLKVKEEIDKKLSSDIEDTNLRNTIEESGDDQTIIVAAEVTVETQKGTEPKTNRCVNIACKSDSSVPRRRADPSVIIYFEATKKKKTLICQECYCIYIARVKKLMQGMIDNTPLMDLEMVNDASELVEISDSESEDEADPIEEPKETIGEEEAEFMERELEKTFNDLWVRYDLDDRLKVAEDSIFKDIQKLEEQTKELDTIINDCQKATDKLRNDLYATFESDRQELTPLIVSDSPRTKTITPSGKRSLSSGSETPVKRPALGRAQSSPEADKPETATHQPSEKPSSPVVSDTKKTDSKMDEDRDIAVLKVSAEAAPSDLPPPGDLLRPQLKPGMTVYAMKNMFRSWMQSKITEVMGKSIVAGSSTSFTICRVKIESNKVRGPVKLLPTRCLAYSEPANARMTIGTRIIALFKDGEVDGQKSTFYSGIIAEVPNPVNNYRYLVFFDDGYAQYVRHADTRLVCECSSLVWEEVHPLSREFVKEYLMAYPERPMVRLHAGQSLKTEWNGKWWPSRVIEVDASLVKVYFEEDNRTEWIYRGSTRLAPLYLELQAAERHRARPMPRTKQHRVNMPYVEYLRSDEQTKGDEPSASTPQQTAEQRESRQRAVAKKSTAAPQPPPPPVPDNVISRVVYYTPKNAVRPYKMTPHNCSPKCHRSDVLGLKDLRTYNPLAKPLLSGWERQIVRYKGHKEVMYRAPCGRRLRNMRELHRYLRLIQSELAVDLFDFTPTTHCLAEFVLNTCKVGKKDLSHGKENVPVPCVNYYDETLPEFCSYNTERTPTAGVPLNLDPEFLCGCDCTDDCADKSKCACWRMTLEGANTIGLKGPNVGYVYKRLPEPLPSGIYECNSRCKCKETCLNRVAQHPLQLKLQVFKTCNRGWGIRALNDVPKGSFLCVYAGNLLTDATANMDGLNEGDEYLAELDYIEVVEQMKEGYEDDIPEVDKKLDKGKPQEESEEEMPSSEDEVVNERMDKDDDDFRPPVKAVVGQFSKRLRKRDKKKDKGKKETQKQAEKAKAEKSSQQKGDEDCITISDDEEARLPSRFTAQAGMQSDEFISKYRSVRSYYGRDEACYIMDAKVQGNIGRYLNHSCTPNVFVQNVFVDTHDPRFPWVAFFALCDIKSGTELTWNYNYDVGSVPGKVLYCYCGATNCRGRLL